MTPTQREAIRRAIIALDLAGCRTDDDRARRQGGRR
jgi:hypothetical protein